MIEFINEFESNSRKLKWRLLICIINGHKGSFCTQKDGGIITESYHCYRCKATWIKNDERERVQFYVC